MIRSLTSESTILPKAAPIMTATARSITLPLTAKSRKSFSIDMMSAPRLEIEFPVGGKRGSDRGLPGLARANPHDLLDCGDEYLAVTDLAGARSLDDGVDRTLDQAVGNDDFDLDLGQKVDDILGATIELGVTFLPPETLHFGDRQAAYADLGQGLAHLVELERLDDRFDFFHCPPLLR